MYKGASNQSLDLKKLYRAGTAPLGSKIPGSATVNIYPICGRRFMAETLPIRRKITSQSTKYRGKTIMRYFHEE